MNFGNFSQRSDIQDTDKLVGHRGTTKVGDVKPESAWTFLGLRTWLAGYFASLTNFNAHTADVANPHSVTKAQVGLGSVDNTSDAAKPVSTAAATALALKVNTSALGAASGVATLDSGGKLPVAQLPDLAVTDYLGSVANQSAMLALVGQKGDWCVRTDDGKVYMISGADPTQIGSWTALSYPASPVVSVAGKTGAVSLVKADVGLGSADNTADTAKPVSTAQAAADAVVLSAADAMAKAGMGELTTFGRNRKREIKMRLPDVEPMDWPSDPEDYFYVTARPAWLIRQFFTYDLATIPDGKKLYFLDRESTRHYLPTYENAANWGPSGQGTLKNNATFIGPGPYLEDASGPLKIFHYGNGPDDIQTIYDSGTRMDSTRTDLNNTLFNGLYQRGRFIPSGSYYFKAVIKRVGAIVAQPAERILGQAAWGSGATAGEKTNYLFSKPVITRVACTPDVPIDFPLPPLNETWVIADALADLDFDYGYTIDRNDEMAIRAAINNDNDPRIAKFGITRFTANPSDVKAWNLATGATGFGGGFIGSAIASNHGGGGASARLLGFGGVAFGGRRCKWRDSTKVALPLPAVNVFANCPYDVHSAANTNEQTLAVSSHEPGAGDVPITADTLINAGDTVRVVAFFSFANNSRTKRIRLYLYDTSHLLWDSGALALQNKMLRLEAFISVFSTDGITHAQTQHIVVSAMSDSALVTNTVTKTTLTLNPHVDWPVLTTAQVGSGAQADDVIREFLLIENLTRKQAVADAVGESP